jgi:4-hydroxy-tetrahydrodipicolinate synthase
MLVHGMVGQEVDGVVALGLASEAWALTESERDAVCATIAEALDGRVPLVVGIDGDTRVAMDRSRRAVAMGAAGLMVLPPTSARPPARSVAHFTTVADAAGVPILVQDSPQITAITLSLDELLAMRNANPPSARSRSRSRAPDPR